MRSTLSSAPSTALGESEDTTAVAESLSSLARGVARARGFALFIAVCNRPAEREALIGVLRDALPDLSLHRVEVPPHADDLLAEVTSQAPLAEGPILVTGLERATPSDRSTHPILEHLNLQRPEWPRRIAQPVVLWVPEYVLALLSRYSPDFLDWRSDTVYFPDLQAERVEYLAIEQLRPSLVDGRMPVQARRDRVAELRQRLAETAGTQDRAVKAARAAMLVELARALAFLGGTPGESLVCLQEAVNLCEALGDQRSRAVALGDIARIKRRQGDVDAALELNQEQTQILRALGEKRELAVALGDLARIKRQMGELDAALQLNHERLGLFEQVGDNRSRAVTLGDIAQLREAKGEVDAALELNQERLRIFDAFGDRRERALTLRDIASIRAGMGELAAALGLHEEALAILEELGETRERVLTLGEIAWIRRQTGDIDEALRLQTERLALSASVGDKRSWAIAQGEIARLRADKGEVDAALRLHQELLPVFEALGDKRERAATLGEIARIQWNNGEVTRALQLHEEALGIFEALGDKRSRAVTLGDIARIRTAKGEVDAALRLHQESLAVFEALGDKRSRAVSLGEIARIRADQGEVGLALRLHQERLAICQAAGDLWGRANALWSIAQLEIGQRRWTEAYNHLTESYQLNLKLGLLDGICAVGQDLGQFLIARGQREEGIEVLTRSRDGFLKLGKTRPAQQTQALLDRLSHLPQAPVSSPANP